MAFNPFGYIPGFHIPGTTVPIGAVVGREFSSQDADNLEAGRAAAEASRLAAEQARRREVLRRRKHVLLLLT
jgi:hypothetical protein